MDDDTSEMRKIEALADIRIVRDLEMIFAAQSVESHICDMKFYLCDLPSDTVVFLDLIVVIAGTAHDADIAELRGRPSLLEIAGVDILITSGISGVPEQVGIYDVFEFISHAG